MAMIPPLKGVAVSLAAIALATAAYAGSASHDAGHGAVKTAEADSSHGAPETRASATETVHGAASWTYSGANGPDNWGGLHTKYAACGKGTTQSPIDLTATHAAGVSSGGIDFAYKPTPLRILNNGHTVQVNYDSGSTMTVEGKIFDLLQLHFHSPGEHAIDGKRADMEIHMVHRNATGEIGVVGVLMNIGAENPALREIWRNMPKSESPERRAPGSMIDARDFLPPDANYFRYMGSLTTPPCSEGVNWFVMPDRIEVSREQVEQFAAVIGANNRPVQKINNRLILAPKKVE